MKKISVVRDIADKLFDEGNYLEAFRLYDEVYREIWSSIGYAQNGINNFSQKYFENSIRASMDFKKVYFQTTVNGVFVKSFDMDIDQVYNEFVLSLYGLLKSVSQLDNVLEFRSKNEIYSEFLILYTLVQNGENYKWLFEILKVVNPLMDEYRLKRLRVNLTVKSIEKFILENAKNLKISEWYNLNIILLDYLTKVNDTSSQFYKSISEIVISKTKEENTKNGYKSESGNFYERYESWERYEKYERFERGFSTFDEVDISRLSEKEKSIYFGKVLGLEGKISKGEIRKRYLSLIAQYHPDKVSDLAPELVKVAEKKTKEINLAFSWFKEKYNI